MNSRRPQCRCGATLIEILLIVAIVGLLVALLVPSLSAGRRGGQRVKCTSQLKQIGQYAGAFAAAEPRGILHPQATSGEMAWIGLGAWDFGGSDGACGEHSTTSPLALHLGSTRRPFNLAGGTRPSAETLFPEYHCPTDTGAANNPNYFPVCSDPRPCSAAEADERAAASMYAAKGTSYQGDFIWFAGVEEGQPVARRFGSFLRPASTMVSASELTLFYETRFAQAFLSTQERADAWGAAAGGAVVAVPGWHGAESRFNVLLCDGNVRTVSVRPRGDALDVVSLFPPDDATPRSAMIRGSGWRIDNLPMASGAWIVEH